MASGDRRKPSTTKRNHARVLAGILALSLGTSSISGLPAHASTNGASTTSTSSDPRSTALAQAASTGQPVTIDSLTTADSTTQALPDGTLATTTTVEPTRMMNSAGSWETIDPTLITNADGSISTTATPNGLTLSGGGSGPVITATDQSGHSLALSLPVTLPTPTLSGTSATYASVYPGVNLTVTAAPTGGFSEVFTVTDPTAEAQAQNIKFTTQLFGLTMSQAADGSMTVTDPSTGQTVMSAPPAAMWDSSTTGAPATGVADEFETVTGATSSAAGPGTDAHTGALPITDTSGTLALNGSTSHLDTSAPTYPIYLDPTWQEPNTSGGTQAYDEVEGASACQGFKNYNNITQPGVGDVTTNTDCPGPYETYFQIDTSNVLNPSYDIKSATLKINEVYSSLNSCNEGSEDIAIYSTPPIGTGTDWSNKPAFGQKITDKVIESDGNSLGTMCSGGTVAGNFDVSSGIALVRAANASNWTFAMVGNETDGSNSLERFNNNPSIYTVYDIKPDTPSNLAAYPAPINSAGAANQDCGGSTPGYMGISNIGGQHLATLTAKLTSPVAAAQMQGIFTFTDTTTNTPYTYTTAGYVTTGATVSVQTTALTDGHKYTWSLHSWDQFDNSNQTATCTFQVDLTPPNNPTITSTDYPVLGSATGGKPAGSSGSFTLSSTDPNPSGGVASGLSNFLYSFDTPIPAIGATSVPAAGNGATLTGPTFNSWGVHTLYVQAVDKAGNRSAQAQYSFYVPWNSSAKSVPGDISGDGIPDFVTTDSSGNLIEYKGGTDPGATPTLISPATDSPNGKSWAGFTVTHDGSFINGNVDDLVILDNNTNDSNGKKELYLYENGTNGFTNTSNLTGPITKTNVTNDDQAFIKPGADAAGNGTNGCLATSTGSCTDYTTSSDWNNVTQFLMVGDFYKNSPNASTLDTGKPGLLTVENGDLWYYQGIGTKDYISTAIQLGKSTSTDSWNNYTLIGPGTVGGKPVLWARNTSGVIYQYAITYDTSGYPNNLGSPLSGSGTALTLPGNMLLPASIYPTITSPGDLHNTGNPDLVATGATGIPIDLPGTAPTNGLATFGVPEALGNTNQYTTDPSYTLPSNGAIYPSGSVWKTTNGTTNTTLSFDQGLLTLSTTNTSTNAVTIDAQYGTGGDPNAYLTLRTDGDLVIYNDITSASPSILWALSRTPGGNTASGDALQLSSSGALNLVSSTNGTLWTAPGSGPAAPGSATDIAYTTGSTISIQTVNSQTPVTTTAQPAASTNPAITALSNGGYLAAYHGTNGDLETVDSSGQITDTGYAMPSLHTSPAITPLGNGAWVIAFQGSNNNFEYLKNNGAPTYTETLTDTGLGMAGNTSPAIDSSPLGWEAAFQNSATGLDLYNGNGTPNTNTGESLDSGSSPSVACLTTPSPGGCEIAFQGTNNDLNIYNTNGTNNAASLGMQAGTSPAIAPLPGGTYAVAFQANTSDLWTYNYGNHGNTGLGMESGTSPAITELPGGNLQIAFQANTTHLWTTDTNTSSDTGHTMANNPSLTPDQVIYP